MTQSNQGVVRDKQGQEQPADMARARTAQKTSPGKSITREATRDPRLNDEEKTPGSGMTPDEDGSPPTG
jgi:hypothetical protein